MKLGEVLDLNKSSKINILDSAKYKIAGVRNFGQGIVIRREVTGIELTMRQYQLISRNQLMWCKVDTKNGAFGITHQHHIGSLASTNMALADINTSKVDPEFLELLFRQKPFADYITNISSGSTNRKYLTPKQLFELVSIPDLSINEQKLFVSKLKRIENINILARIQNQKQLLSKLKQSILQEAIQGKLTKEWRKKNQDIEPASKLLERIKAEKIQLIKDKKIKKENPLPSITEEEVPFELPEGWVWCRLGDVSIYLNGKSFDSEDFQKHVGVKCIKITNVGVGEIISTEDTLPNKFYEKYKGYLVYTNDVVMALTRPYIAEGLKVSLCPESYNKSLLNQRVAVIRGFEGVSNSYIYKYLKSDFVLEGYKNEFESKSQQPNLKSKHITDLLFPLAPSLEQEKIIEKLGILMEKCKTLETEITKSEQNVKVLMQAILKEAFESEKELVI